jgi:hypothetical protein
MFSELGKPTSPSLLITSINEEVFSPLRISKTVLQSHINYFQLPSYTPLRSFIMLRAQKLSSAFTKHTRTFATVTQPPQVGVVRPSAQEVKNWTLDSRNLEKAVRHMHRDGLVVVEDVVPHEDIDILNKKMIEDAHTLQARGDKGPFNYNKGNIQQDAPPVSEYFSPSIFTSKYASTNLSYPI